MRQKKLNDQKSGCFLIEHLSLRGCYNIRSRGLQAIAFSIGGTLKKLNLKGLPGKNYCFYLKGGSKTLLHVPLTYIHISVFIYTFMISSPTHFCFAKKRNERMDI